MNNFMSIAGIMAAIGLLSSVLTMSLGDDFGFEELMGAHSCAWCREGGGVEPPASL